MPTRPTLTVREIVLGLAAGAVAAGGAAAMLSAFDDDDGYERRPAIAQAAERDYTVAPFSEISTIGPQDLVITYGETQSITADGPAQSLDRLEVVVVDGELTIRPKDMPGFDDWGRFGSTTFRITIPRLERVSLAGSGDITVDRVEGERFEGAVAGPGDLSIATLDVDRADLSVNGAGTLDVAGSARQTRASIGGSGEVDGEHLTSATASVSIGGSGDVALRVDDRALISIAGSGNVDITGPATCSVSRMGSGAVSCNGEEQ